MQVACSVGPRRKPCASARVRSCQVPGPPIAVLIVNSPQMTQARQRGMPFIALGAATPGSPPHLLRLKIL
jgi:hypothetical protein